MILSPHWMTPAVTVSASPRPPTIHDFGGFPAELYALRYPAPGDPALAARVVQLLAGHGGAHADATRGLDHGAWVPLRYLYPDADVPVVQVSLPTRFGPKDAYRLGELLAPLSAEGVLIVGSGSLTHNLSEFKGPSHADDAEYVRRFVAWSRAAVTAGDTSALMDYLTSAPDARRAHPTSDHLPLPFAAGAAPAGTRARVIDGGIAYGILSMDSSYSAPSISARAAHSTLQRVFRSLARRRSRLMRAMSAYSRHALGVMKASATAPLSRN